MCVFASFDFRSQPRQIYCEDIYPPTSPPPPRSFPPTLSTSFTMNVTAVPPVDGWAGYVAEAQKYLPPPSRLALLCLINVPIFAVVLNVLRQLVRCYSFVPTVLRCRVANNIVPFLCVRRRSSLATNHCLLKSSIGSHSLVQHRDMATTPLNFSSSVVRRCVVVLCATYDTYESSTVWRRFHVHSVREESHCRIGCQG